MDEAPPSARAGPEAFLGVFEESNTSLTYEASTVNLLQVAVIPRTLNPKKVLQYPGRWKSLGSGW